MMAVRERGKCSFSPLFSLLDDALDVGARHRALALVLPVIDFLDLNPPGIMEMLSCESRPAGSNTETSTGASVI